MNWGEDYVTLALRIEKYFEGFVDAYCGPPSLKNAVLKEEKIPLDTLSKDADYLLHTIPAEDEARKIFLEKQVNGIKTTIQILQGEKIDFLTQVEHFFDITPQRVPDAQLESHKQTLYDIFQTTDLIAAVEKWRSEKEIKEKILNQCIDLLSTECRARTKKIVDLPEKEQVEFVLVHDKPWGGYNWYLGDYRSRIEINTDVPVNVTGLPSLVSHEAYPGHHTEHSIKENVLYHGKGYTEASIFVYNTPECIISEGIATAGFDMIFDKKEAFSFLNKHLNLNINVEKDAAISEALNKLSASSGNAALMLHKDNEEPQQVIQYLQDMGLSSKKQAEKQVEFMTHPLFKVYVFNYYMGKELISNAHIDPETLYTVQLCPSNMKYYTA
ncbi:MAG: hypothetical protein PVF58_05445 [Candidatus Methanofastidiosia archaeon]|jgi:hypothetical protein